MRRFGDWLRRLAPLVLAGAGGVAALAAAPVSDQWSADSDSLFMLDVNVHQMRLGEGVRAYGTPEGSCIVFGDFIQVLDVPLKIDLAAHHASGWAFKESHRIAIDQAAGVATIEGKPQPISPHDIREVPEGWCVDSKALARWFGIEVKPITSASVLELVSPTKLPVELAREREIRAKNLHKASFPLAGLPEVKLPYRMWRAPALDFIVSGGLTYNANSGARVDRRASVAAAGEIANMSYDVRASFSGNKLDHIKVSAFRSDPDGELLGPLRATHFAIGDVANFNHRLLPVGEGRGFEVTNRPLFNPAAFDRTRLEGELPIGWDAELYRNGQLLAFSHGDGSQRYVFDDVQLLYGDNRFEVVLYGPQGQRRSRVESYNVGQSHVPPGQTWYWAGANQPGRDLLGFRDGRVSADSLGGVPLATTDPPKVPRDAFLQPKIQGAISLEHGLDKRTSVAMLASMLIAGDRRLTFIEGSVRRSVGPALVEAAVTRQGNGGMALRLQALGKLGSVNFSGEAIALNKFLYNGLIEDRLRLGRLTIDAPIHLGHGQLATSADISFTERGPGVRSILSNARLSTNVGAIGVTTGVLWQHDTAPGSAALNRFDLSALASGRIGKVRVRGSGIWEFSPSSRLRSAELSAYWSSSKNADWEGAVGFDGDSRRYRARLTHVHRFSSMAVAASVEGGSDRSFALGFNLNFSLDGSRGGMRLSRQPLASAGEIHARVFRDDNDNGVRDVGEPYEVGAVLTAGTSGSSDPTGKTGEATIVGLTPYRPVAVGIDPTSLPDPSLAPRKALQLVIPRPGITAYLDIALVGAGDVEASLTHDDGRGFEGLDVELVDGAGKVVDTARTDYDGFLLFERVPYGHYTLRLTADSAAAAHSPVAVPAAITLTPDAPVMRLGAIRLGAAPVVALHQ